MRCPVSERSLWIHPMGILIAGIIFYFLWNRYLLGKSARGMKTLIILAIAALVFFYLFRMYLASPLWYVFPCEYASPL